MKPSLHPDLSVILPAYNASRYLPDAIESVLSTSRDTSVEVIVVDDGSTDRITDVIAPYLNKITFVRQLYAGVSAARNTGIQQANGKYISFIDADDIWTTGHNELIQLLESDPAKEIAMGFSQRFSDHGSLGEPVLLPTFGCAVIRHQVFAAVGLLNIGLSFHEDIEWYLRARELGIPFVITRKVVKKYRLHDRNATRNLSPTDTSLVSVLHASLQRRANLSENRKHLASLQDFLISN